MNLRSCLDYLEFKYKNRIDPRRSHPAFLCALLRIADYFQIQATRAPTARTEVDTFHSELSEREWMVHQSIRDIHNTSGDPEAIVVIAAPNDVETFLKLKTWIGGLQKELDQSWAVLGEVYGLQSHNNLNLLGLKIRRIKSNIDDTIAFADTVDFIPEKIAFEAANADLLKLLVAPLYGNDAGIGIRELLQNAIDAVREYDDSQLRRSGQEPCSRRYEQDADVTLRIECNENGMPTLIVITDRGIGMTTEIVRDYFLKAGASFRRNNLWREEHEDSEGHSRVLRTGRFGVGALAAFLLGDEIEVTSRHAFLGKSGGINFTAKLDDETISLNKVSCPVGTQIKIKIPETTAEHPDADSYANRVKAIIPAKQQKTIQYGSGIGHYFLTKPSLARQITGYPDIPVESFLPLPDDDVSSDWRWFKTPEFEKIFWTHSKSYPSLSCNGIVISPRRADSHLEQTLGMPNISVFDRDGLLPLNLQRQGLRTALPFHNELLESISDDLIAYALLEVPDDLEDSWFYDGGYEGFRDDSYQYYYSPQWSRWLITKDGFLLSSGDLAAEFNPKSLIAIVGGHKNRKGIGSAVRTMLTSDALGLSCLPNAFASTDVRTKGSFLFAINGGFLPRWVRATGYNVYIPDCLVKKIEHLRPGKAVKRGLEKLSKEISPAGWRAFPAGGLSDDAIFSQVASLPIDPENPTIICAYEINEQSLSKTRDVVAKRWIELLGAPLIPFNPAQRKQLIKKMGDRLPELMKVRGGLRKRASKSKARAIDVGDA